MGEIASKPRPINFIIMTNKKFYEKIFRFLKEGVFSQDGIERCPILAMTDYEKAMRNAFGKVWPVCDLRGCFFHLSKALLDRAKKPGLLAIGIVSCADTIYIYICLHTRKVTVIFFQKFSLKKF